MKNLFKFDHDAARVLSIIFAVAAVIEVTKSICLTAYAMSQAKKGNNVSFKL